MVETLMQQLDRAKREKQPLDLVTLDELLDAKIPLDQLAGLSVDWHGRQGVTVKREDSWKPLSGQPQKYRLAIRTRVQCDRHCGRKVRLTVISGVHKGAWCIAIDSRGNRVADLRDQISICGHCTSK